MRWRLDRTAALLLMSGSFAMAQGPPVGAIAGRVSSDAGEPLRGARVTVTERGTGAAVAGGGTPREESTDVRGEFRIAPLPAGSYSVTVRLLGFRPAELPLVRVVPDDTVRTLVTLTRAPTRLSTVVVVRSPTSIEALSSESSVLIERATAMHLPTGRDASVLVALVPGAKDGNLWGGAGAVTNDYRVDGVSMNHPGAGGDFLKLPRDWIEALEIRGVGANAEYGNFQGGMVNALTRAGTNQRRMSLRTYHESERLTATNFDLAELGVEQASRSELSGEVAGPIRRDRLFYFVGGQLLERSFRSPDLASTAPRDFQRTHERRRDLRAVAKFTWARAPGDRADLLLGYTAQDITNAGIDGLADPTALQRVRAPTRWYDATWRRTVNSRLNYELRIAGFDARESRDGNGGPETPGIRLLRLSDLPSYQNSEFSQRSDPASHAASMVLRTAGRALGAEHAFAAGAEFSFGEWTEARTRNGGLTWRPYVSGTTAFVPTDAATWTTTGSDWGGERYLSSRVSTAALFVQDEVAIAQRLSIAPGLRMSHWTGALAPCDPAGVARSCGRRARAVTATGLDPRVGIAWDLTGRNTLALKAHWGRYHQGMYALFFDRATGANAYSNARFHYTAPPLSDARQTYTPSERDALIGPSGFSSFFDETILDESGAVRGYRQPYVDQSMVSVQKTFGRHWKLEVLGIARTNGDVVGLVDRNLQSNYTALANISVDHRLAIGAVLDARGAPLVLPRLYVSNRDLADAIAILNANLLPGQAPRTFAGYGPSDVAGLTFAPDVVLGPLAAARRRYRQLTATLTTEFGGWLAQGSLTTARLAGNVAGATGHGVAGTAFTAGPFVRPNEAINFEGALPDATEFEAKLWMTARLPFDVQGGIIVTHILGERITPNFTIEGRYAFGDAAGQRAPAELVRQVIGQSVFVEPRGSRHYASRSLLDLHLERRFTDLGARHATLSVDLFNALGSRALVRVKTSIDDQATADPASRLGAARERVAPRSIRLGLRID